MTDRIVTNLEIAQALQEIAIYLDMDGIAFKPRAYDKAAQAVSTFPRRLHDVWREGGAKALDAVPGLGKSISAKIDELFRTGAIGALQALRERFPVDVAALTRVDGIGPKTVKLLWAELGVQTLDDLERAAREGRLEHVPHFGRKTQERVLKGIAFVREGHGRLPIIDALAYVRPIEARLRALPSVQTCVIAGSLRRFRETIGDVDFLVVSQHPESVIEAFVGFDEVVDVHARGVDTKASVRFANGLDADLRVVPAESLGAALCYFTGSKAHNVHMRRLAIAKGYKLNEYGLFRVDDDVRVAGLTEEEIHAALDLAYIPPELREDQGEIEAARDGRLPCLIERGALRGDVQIQTSWTDGHDSIEDMAHEARRLGLEYIAITDHTRDLAMTGGSDEAKLRDQMAWIRAHRDRLGVHVLCGAEVNIRKDGSLDIDDETLSALDFVGVAIHHHFDLPRDAQTQRVIRALENPHVDMWFHPTARKLGERPPVDIDLDACIAAAVRTHTVLELDAHGRRLDLRDEHVRLALRSGAKICINSDAHAIADMAYPDAFGIPVARRGWATADDVVNTQPLPGFLASLKRSRRR
ncbi:MAG: DNA polymerase/3'-5' exonuclease PolX [Proteobacteria bacterium]|nr:DNA polymerase/3'-5' exonuclease PolX [Pseudomonadota bacterium]